MNIFDRFARVIRSYANAIISSFEDPEKILEQAVLEMNDDLTKMRQATAQVLASQKQLENKYKVAQQASDEWYRRAQLALSKGDEDLAREALKRRKAYADNAGALRAQLDQQKTVVDNLVSNTRLLESKIQEARSKKDTLRARAQSAKTATRVSEMLGNVNTSSALAAFEKMEEKVLAMESQADALNQLTTDDLEGKFALLESSSVDDDLAKLKKELSGVSKKGDLPPGRTAVAANSPFPFQDSEIERELNELRRKAKELRNGDRRRLPPPRLPAPPPAGPKRPVEAPPPPALLPHPSLPPSLSLEPRRQRAPRPPAAAAARMSYNPTPATDRLISAAAYTLPFFNSLQYGRFLFLKYPSLSFLFDPLLPLLSLYKSVPYASFVAFFALYLGVVRNPSFSHYVRFNAMQAVTLDVLLVLPLLLQRIFNPGRAGLGFRVMPRFLHSGSDPLLALRRRRCREATLVELTSAAVEVFGVNFGSCFSFVVVADRGAVKGVKLICYSPLLLNSLQVSSYIILKYGESRNVPRARLSSARGTLLFE
ncbi:hypothetical protein NL676_030262 [Syzygium grande]|nr:hypothetical protein NL676_030262 [Syzygium grande]